MLGHIRRWAKAARRVLADIFSVRREERRFAIVMLILIVAMNALVLAYYHDAFTKPTTAYWDLFIKGFHISGFDPITYVVVSDWMSGYNIYRHPLLAFFMYPFYLINAALMWLTGVNCAIYIVAAVQVFCAFYALLFFRRILREHVGTDETASSLLALLLFSFAYVMLSAVVPDHFIMSFMLLLLTLWLSGRWLKGGKRMTIGCTWLLFVLTAGVSLNNGLKTFFASLFVNGRHFFRPKYLLLAVILPSALIWGSARMSYRQFVWPREIAQKAEKAKQRAEKARQQREAKAAQRQADSLRMDSLMRIYPTADTTFLTSIDSVLKAQTTPKKKVVKRRRRSKPIANGEFISWTDISTTRPQSIVENLFGESIQLHDQYLLKDTLIKRPVIVPYSWTLNYVVEALLVAFFVVGVWCGRRSRLLWIALSWFGMDMLLHVALGFGLQEVYIMTAHWAFVMPLSMAFAVKKVPPRHSRKAHIAVATTAFCLLAYNATLLVKYLYW